MAGFAIVVHLFSAYEISGIALLKTEEQNK